MVDINFIVEIIQLIYKIPSVLLMILSIYVIIKEIKYKNNLFNKQFYIIIVFKLTNEIAFNTNMFVFFILPKWGFYNKFLENHAWTATVFNILATQQTTFMFLITLLISINRYIGVKYPFSYELYFSKPKIVIILLSSIILSLVLGFGNIFFDLRYQKSNFFGYFTPSLKTKKELYYQYLYLVILFGLISIITCIFNVMAILTLKKVNKIGSQYKKEIYFIVYSIFIFITLLFVEAFFVVTFIGVKYQINFFIPIIYFLNIVAFDLTSVGDFYFLIYSW
uniref:Serpentine receptor class gamma n=1 Tax=Strongyloides venezuelensis TaxID=75913 RepID=A0A0K0G5I1_STRVS